MLKFKMYLDFLYSLVMPTNATETSKHKDKNDSIKQGKNKQKDIKTKNFEKKK